jgi:hypothetical protein
LSAFKPELRALAVVPQGVSLVEREAQVAAWIDEQKDAQELRKAKELLAFWRIHAERGSSERDAAIRLDIRCERRLGQLPEAAPKPPGPAAGIVTARNEPTPTVERVALSRARAIAAIPQPLFEEKLAEPKPSREKMLAVAVIPNPTVDPVEDESARVFRNLRGPARESWPSAFDLSLLNEKAVLVVRQTQESWCRWCDQWDAALVEVPQLRRVK